MHVVKVCRVCLGEYDELTPLRAKLPGENKTLVESINFVVNINMKLEDGLPDKICKNCETVLDLADTFKKRCLESEAILSQPCVTLVNEKGADESRPILESNCQENSERHSLSENTSSLPAIMPCTASPDSLGEGIGNEENVYDFLEYKIKMEIVDENTISEQAHLDAAQDCEATLTNSQEQCSIEGKHSEKSISHSDGNECYSCSYCDMIFKTNISYKVHLFCKHNPKALSIADFSLCKDTFTCMSRCEVRLERLSGQRDQNGRGTNGSGDSLWEELHQGEEITHCASPFLGTEASCTKNLKLSDFQPITPVVTSATEEQEAAVSPATPIIENENVDKAENTDLMKKKQEGKLKLDENKETTSYIAETNIENTLITGSMLKLSDTNTGDIIPCASEEQSKYINNTTANTTGAILTCDICTYTTASIRSFNLHLRAHTAMNQYSCDFCPYITVNSKHYDVHVNMHTGVKPYSCEICKKKFSIKNNFVTHLKTHTGEKPYSCEICKKKFSIKSNLVTHLKTHTGDKPYSCEICKKKFGYKSHLVRHFITHTDDKPYSCEICKKKFGHKSYLLKHFKTHTDDKPYCCEICKKKFREKYYLFIHARTHAGEKPYSCEICKKQFSVNRTLLSHLKTHTSDKPYCCEICKKKFGHKSYLVRHFITHTDDKPYSCETCKKKFGHKSYLVRHFKTHTNDKPYCCEICKKKFREKYYLFIHARTHTGEKPYSCEICKENFSHKTYLVRHFITHTDDKPYCCEICQKKFREKHDLFIHARTHTGEKPYSCEICKYNFSHKTSLVKHFKTHTDDKPYGCEICKKKFREKYNLFIHARIHTGEKPYSCEICKKKFNHKSYLVRHFTTHSGDKHYCCDMCQKKFKWKDSLVCHVRTRACKTGRSSTPDLTSGAGSSTPEFRN